MAGKRARPASSSGTQPKKIPRRREYSDHAAKFIDDEAEEDNDVEADEDDEDAESVHSTFSMLMREREAAEPNEHADQLEHPADGHAEATSKSVKEEDVHDDGVVGVPSDTTVSIAPVPVAAPVASTTPPSTDPKPKNDDARVPPVIKRTWVPGRPRLNQRIDKLHVFANDDELTYSVLSVPADVRMFASDDTVRDRVYMLGRPLKNRPTLAPITVWIVGRLTRVYLRDNNGGLPKSVSVNVRPVDPRALHAAVGLLRRHTTDAAGLDRYDDLRASRWMTVKPPGEIADRVDSFDAIWDARKVLTSPRDKMVPVFASDVNKGDLVLVEANVARYRVIDKTGSQDGSAKNKKKKAENWAAYFALKSICILDDTPVAADPDAEAPVGSWEL